MKYCCHENVHKAERKGRAWYICPVCKSDVSLLWFLFQEAMMGEAEASAKLAVKKKKS